MVKTQKPETSNEPILSRILKEAWEHSQSGKTFLAAFDLDSTLYDLTLRIATIVDDFAEDPIQQRRFPEECKGLKNVVISPRDWGLEKPLHRAGLRTDGEFFKALHDHWAQGFFSNDYLIHDEPMPGAVEYVQELHQAGAHIMYLTARDAARYLPGTDDSLREHGFPMVTGTAESCLKPTAELDDAEFKLNILSRAEEKYERIWLFENEPVNINLVAKHCPEIGLVFIDSTHSGREEIAPTLDKIPHFEVDLSDFRAHVSQFRK